MDGFKEVKFDVTPLEGHRRLNTLESMGNGKLNPAEATASAKMENILGVMGQLPEPTVAGKSADFIICCSTDLI